MATKTEHLTKSANNETFAGSLDTSSATGIEWKLTALFYAAVHYIQAYLIGSSKGPITNHSQRDSAIFRDAKIRPIYVDYQELKTHSRDARYEANSGFTTSDVEKQQRNLAAIKAEVAKHL